MEHDTGITGKTKKKAIIAGGVATLLIAGGITGGVVWHNHNAYQKALETCESNVTAITTTKDEAKKLSADYATFLAEYAEYGNEAIQKGLDGVNNIEIGTCGKDTFETIKNSATEANTALENAKKDFETAKAKAVDGNKTALHDQIKMLGETYKGFVEQTTLDSLNKSTDEINSLEGIQPVKDAVNTAVTEAQAKKTAHEAEEARKAQEAAEAAQKAQANQRETTVSNAKKTTVKKKKTTSKKKANSDSSDADYEAYLKSLAEEPQQNPASFEDCRDLNSPTCIDPWD